jgi:hypothetical protein
VTLNPDLVRGRCSEIEESVARLEQLGQILKEAFLLEVGLWPNVRDRSKRAEGFAAIRVGHRATLVTHHLKSPNRQLTIANEARHFLGTSRLSSATQCCTRTMTGAAVSVESTPSLIIRNRAPSGATS